MAGRPRLPRGLVRGPGRRPRRRRHQPPGRGPNRWARAAPGPAVVQRPEAAVEELRRSVQDLDAVGAYFGSDARTFLDDAEIAPVYSACVELDLPLFVHAAMPGIDGPPGDRRLERWIGQAVLGYPFEDTVATTTFLSATSSTGNPGLDVCLTHGGGATAMFWGRISAFARTARGPFTDDRLREHMHRLWFDYHVHSPASADLLRQLARHPVHLILG
ncbi:amidohydrolase family protein [Pseudonocardia lutea]|uniref:Amidohydrolase family protein n=1 Tax=Pseudonocardia lutea TaxID=2172015 RepID=A0ABW1I3Q7_9PSEU